jgi:hypothetical protein
MTPDVLSKKVLSRLRELGLPACLVDIEEFRDKFFHDQWVMFVRDSDKIANVHLVEPQQGKRVLGTEHGSDQPTQGKDRRI